MYKILIFGTGSTCKVLEISLDENIEIIGYIDNDTESHGKKRNNLIIESPNNIHTFNYDFIVIASQYNEVIYRQLLKIGISKFKIFQFYKFIDLNFNYIKYRIENYLYKSNDKFEVLITGLSYSLTGIHSEFLSKRSLNLAAGSQDIFYDYQIIKYLLANFSNRTKDVKYIIIGLSYYSFQYDLSLSGMKNKTVLYYPLLKTSHHFENINEIFDEYLYNLEIAEKILKRDNNCGFTIKWSNPSLCQVENRDLVGKKQSERDSNKDYPKTVEENINIFNDYLSFLRKNNIKPIVTVLPTSTYYSKYFSKKIESEFHSIINKFKVEYNFQYIDYFRSNLFNDDDFADVSHLNFKGAKKFTKLLNKLVEW